MPVKAIELARSLRPDVILMDLHMPLKGGVSATREIIRAQRRGESRLTPQITRTAMDQFRRLVYFAPRHANTRGLRPC
jgi:CheY-like chemotaxis protein